MMCTQTDNLLKNLQSARMNFVERKVLGDSVLKLLFAMREDDQFYSLSKKGLCHSITDMGEPKNKDVETTIISFKCSTRIGWTG